MVFVFGCLVCAWLGSWVWGGCNVLLGLWLIDCSGFDNLLIRLGKVCCFWCGLAVGWCLCVVVFYFGGILWYYVCYLLYFVIWL